MNIGLNHLNNEFLGVKVKFLHYKLVSVKTMSVAFGYISGRCYKQLFEDT